MKAGGLFWESTEFPSLRQLWLALGERKGGRE
jgi:hypothetical protein